MGKTLSDSPWSISDSDSDSDTGPVMTMPRTRLTVSVTREYAWEMGHALANHDGKCFNPHGHNYRAEVEFSGPISLESGMVVDFDELDKHIKPYLQEQYDHKFLFNIEDKRFSEDQYGTRVQQEPTAENLAMWIWTKVEYMLFHRAMVKLQRVTVWETDKASATIRRS